ncbi:MAG: CRISPR-associated protein Cas4 [Thiothrix sp.]
MDSSESGMEYGVRVERSLPLFSARYGLTGRADVVEFLDDGTPFPVEYKQGKRQQKIHDETQLVGQALCLEEMTGKAVPEGAIFHHKSRRRRVVAITPELREYTLRIVGEVRALLESGKLPPPVDDRSLCQACSLLDTCQPELSGNRARIRRLHDTLYETDDEEA